MTFDFDDNLNEQKRKNRNPVHTTNLLIIAGFIALGVMMVFFMNSGDPVSYSDAEIEATIDARLSEYITTQSEQASQPETSQQVESVSSNEPTMVPPTVTPRQVIEGTELIVGGVIEGTITDDTFEIDYTYEGEANTPIVITMQSKGLEELAVILTNPYGNRIVTSATEQVIGDEDTHVVAAVLPIDGQYVITATRRDGRAGDTEGDFQLMLDVPEYLQPQSRISGVTDSTSWQWYAVRQDDPFSVTYTKVDGSFSPEIGVYRLDVLSKLRSQAYLFGEDMSFGTLGRFADNQTHFIAIGQHTLQTTYDVAYETSEYTLGIQIAR